MKKSFLLLIFIQLISQLMVAQTNVADLSIEYLSNPVGIDVEAPRFSWAIQSKERGFNQSAYQVLVASSPEKLNEESADIWNSGKVISASSVLIPFTHHQLSSGQRYFRVKGPATVF